MTTIPPRVAKAAMSSGAATRPIEDFAEYKRKLRHFVFRSGLVMKPVFERAQKNPQRVILAEGDSSRVLNATQILVDDKICTPVLLGSPERVQSNIDGLGLRLKIGEGFEIIDPADNPDYDKHVADFLQIMGRRGVSPEYAANVIRTRTTALGSIMLNNGEADALICGTQGAYARHLSYLCDIVGLREGVNDCSAVILLILDTGTYFLTDTHVTVDPTCDEVAETAVMASEVVRRFGMEPRIALLSHSNFGSRNNTSALKMREAREILHQQHPELSVEGEMHADAALSDEIRDRVFPAANYRGQANLLVMPNLDAANIAYNLTKVLANGLPVGPMLMGMLRPAHVVTESVTVRGIVNMCAIAAVDAIDRKSAIE